MAELLCEGCGAEISAETQFCNECGRPVNSGRDALLGVKKEVQSRETQSEPKNLAPSSLPGAISVGLSVLFTIFIFVSHPFDFVHQKRTLIHVAIAAGLAIIGAIMLILADRKTQASVEN